MHVPGADGPDEGLPAPTAIGESHKNRPASRSAANGNEPVFMSRVRHIRGNPWIPSQNGFNFCD
jgi:hypothetical protein